MRFWDRIWSPGFFGGVSDLGEGVSFWEKGLFLVGFFWGRLGFPPRERREGGIFRDFLRSDGGEGPILVEKGAEKPQRWGEF